MKKFDQNNIKKIKTIRLRFCELQKRVIKVNGTVIPLQSKDIYKILAREFFLCSKTIEAMVLGWGYYKGINDIIGITSEICEKEHENVDRKS